MTETRQESAAGVPEGAAAGPGGRPVYRVRRMPDVATWRGSKARYEVARFDAPATDPTWVRADPNPGTVLRREGVHPTDIYDYVYVADEAWNGDVGPWPNPYPEE